MSEHGHHHADPDDRPGWEYLLFADELEAGLARLSRVIHDHEAGFVRPSGESLPDRGDAVEYLEAQTAELAQIVANVERLLSQENVQRAMGAPGEPGDAARIRHLAASVVEIAEMMLAWAARLRAASVPPELEPVYWAASSLIDRPLGQIREFVEHFARTVRAALGTDPPAGPDEPVHLEFELTLEVDDGALAAFHSALEQAIG